MNRILEPLEQEIYKLTGQDIVEEIIIEDDGLPEGWLNVNIRLNENLITDICEQEGFNTEDWDES